MFSLRVDFYTGVAYLRARYRSDGKQTEWPPHPSRVFQALVAANSKCDEAKDQALHWLETLGPPQIAASAAHNQMPLTVYVPVNALGSPGAKPTAKTVMPFLPNMGTAFGRNQPQLRVRTCPVDPKVYFIWPEATLDDEMRPVLASLCKEVSYVGASESFAQVSIVDYPPEPNWIPDPLGSENIRVPVPGLLDYLRERHKAESRPEPQAGEWQKYRPARPARIEVEDARYVQGEHSRLIPLELLTDQPVGVKEVLMVSRETRDALLRACPTPVPEWVSGHLPDGGASKRSHLGVVPLAPVDGSFARAQVLGVGLLIPRYLLAEEVSRCLARVLDSRDGQEIMPGMRIRRPQFADEVPWALNADSWCRPSRIWRTVTPIVFNRWPTKKVRSEDQLRTMLKECGLPDPVAVNTGVRPFVEGVPFAQDFPQGKWKNRFRLHAELQWDFPIAGPVVIGAGRYTGMGFALPGED